MAGAGGRTGAALLAVAVLAQADVASPFVDATARWNLRFRHVNGAFGSKWMPESLGAGVALFDADGDGWTDVYLVQGAPWPGHEEAVPESLRAPTGRLYRNLGGGRLEDVTAGSGLELVTYGFGAAAADYDADGRIDLYVTAYGPNRLFHNLGGGRFEELAAAAGVDHPGWSTSAAWLDYDRDGDLDLFVASYVRWSPDRDIWCTLDGSHKAYCTPESYAGEPSVLYRNEGDGTFTDVTRAAGVYAPGGKSLGVTVEDFDGDGWPDLAVANDTEPNFLFRNRQDGTFEEIGLVSGMAFDANGRARAGMGIDAGDIANDGRIFLAIGNFSKEMIGLFARDPAGVFLDVAARAGIGRSSFPFLTFGLFFFDYDLDGALDLFAANGHLEESIAAVESSISYAQRPLLYHNDGSGRFEEIGERVGGVLARPIVGRGAAYADLDRDGDLDVVVTTNGGSPLLLENRVRQRRPAPQVLRVQLVDDGPNWQAIGAVLWLRAGGRVQRRSVHTGGSYASQSELVATFGLAEGAELQELRVRWPDGTGTSLAGEQLGGARDHQLLVGRDGVRGRVPLLGPAR